MGRLLSRVLSCGVIAIALSSLIACTESPSKPDAIYTIRGRVVTIPDAENRGSELRIHHEAIPTYKSRKGEIIGMHEMTMPFYLKDFTLLKGIEKGDAIEFIVEERWNAQPAEIVVSLKKIPQEELALTRE